jgi:ATP phosphoribosyltransferase
MSAPPLVLALPKGRVLDEVAPIFARAGVDLAPIFGPSRKLMFDCGDVRVLVLRNADIPTYVAHGAAALGVCGSDVLDEEGRDLYQPLDLGVARCRMIVAERQGARIDDRTQLHLRVGSKYPRTTRRYLAARGITAEVIPLSGAIELAPLTGLCERIVDITQSGETLRQNGLVEIDTVAEVSTRVVVGPAAMRLGGAPLAALLTALERAIA